MATVSAAHRPNHLLWLGPVVGLAGLVTYFIYFARFPALRDFPWVNLPLVLLGATLAAIGYRRARASAPSRWVRWAAGASLLSSILFAALLAAYVFWLSYQIPPPTATALTIAAAPDFTLEDQDGRPVRLADFRGTKVVLVFYRGFW